MDFGEFLASFHILDRQHSSIPIEESSLIVLIQLVQFYFPSLNSSSMPAFSRKLFWLPGQARSLPKLRPSNH